MRVDTCQDLPCCLRCQDLAGLDDPDGIAWDEGSQDDPRLLHEEHMAAQLPLLPPLEADVPLPLRPPEAEGPPAVDVRPPPVPPDASNSSTSCSSDSSSGSSSDDDDQNNHGNVDADSLASSSEDEPADATAGDHKLFDNAADSETDDEAAKDHFADLTTASGSRHYCGQTVHFWTVAHTQKPGAKTAENCSKKSMMRIFRDVYGAAVLVFWAIFTELHNVSRRAWERKPHYHIILRLARRVKWKRHAAQLRTHGVYGHLSIPTRHADVWRIFAYCYVPTLKKPLTELDPDPLFSSSFPLAEMERRLKGRLATDQRIRPWDFYQMLRRLGDTVATFSDLVEWTKLQKARGLDGYERFLAQQGPKMPSLFASWQRLLARDVQDGGQRALRLKLWDAAASAPCLCTTPMRLSHALKAALEFHGKDPARFAWVLRRLVHLGTTCKNVSMLLFGASNTGKTGLTRPLIHIFESASGEAVWLRPNAGDTFPLEGLQTRLLAVWQDWRIGQSPVPWDTLLLILEGESIVAAAKGLPSTTVHHPPGMVITTQERVVYRDKRGQVNQAEQQAFNNRFALRWHLRHALPPELADPQLKLCYACIGCYARLMNDLAQTWAHRHPDDEAEVSAMAKALDAQQAKRKAAKRARLERLPTQRDQMEAHGQAARLPTQHDQMQEHGQASSSCDQNLPAPNGLADSPGELVDGQHHLQIFPEQFIPKPPKVSMNSFPIPNSLLEVRSLQKACLRSGHSHLAMLSQPSCLLLIRLFQRARHRPVHFHLSKSNPCGSPQALTPGGGGFHPRLRRPRGVSHRLLRLRRLRRCLGCLFLALAETYNHH